MNNNMYKGSEWVPTFAGTHAPSGAGQNFDLSESIFDREEIPLPHITLFRLPRKRYRLTVEYILLPLLA